MKSNLFALNLSDVGKAVLVAFLVAVIGGIQQALVGHGLDILNYNWGEILNLGFISALGYLSKNFLSDNQGSFLGIASY